MIAASFRARAGRSPEAKLTHSALERENKMNFQRVRVEIEHRTDCCEQQIVSNCLEWPLNRSLHSLCPDWKAARSIWNDRGPTL